MTHIQMETVLFVFFAVALIFLIARLATAPVQMMLKLLFNLTPYLAQKIDKLLYDVIEICPFFVIYSFCSVDSADSAGA